MKNRMKVTVILMMSLLVGSGFAFAMMSKPTMPIKTIDDWNTAGFTWNILTVNQQTGMIYLDFEYEYPVDVKKIRPIVYYDNPDSSIEFGTFEKERIVTAIQPTEPGTLKGMIIYGLDEHNNEFALASFTKLDMENMK
jgi:hypothetical protein